MNPGPGTTTHPHMLGGIYGYKSVFPAIGAFVGGVSLPYANVGNYFGALGAEGMIVAGCAIGALIGDFLLHLIQGDAGKLAMNLRHLATDAVYAGVFALLGVFGLRALGFGTTTQYLGPLVSALGLYYTQFSYSVY